MSYYEGTYIDRLPQELQDRIGVPVVVGRLLTLPAELIDYIFTVPRRAALTITRVIRGYLVRDWTLQYFGADLFGNNWGPRPYPRPRAALLGARYSRLVDAQMGIVRRAVMDIPSNSL